MLRLLESIKCFIYFIIQNNIKLSKIIIFYIEYKSNYDRKYLFILTIIFRRKNF
jgi:hypothetical protein